MRGVPRTMRRWSSMMPLMASVPPLLARSVILVPSCEPQVLSLATRLHRFPPISQRRRLWVQKTAVVAMPPLSASVGKDTAGVE